MFRNKLLKELREKKRLSTSELMFALDRIGLRVSRATLINWENGATEPRISQAFLLSKFFSKPLGDFFDGKQSKSK